MKYLQILAQSMPEISYTSLNFNKYMTFLTENVLLAILFFFGIMALSFLCYYACCVLVLFISRFVGFKYKSDPQPTFIINESSNI